MTDNNFLVKVSQGGKFYELVRFVIVGGAATVTDLAVSIVLFFDFPDKIPECFHNLFLPVF